MDVSPRPLEHVVESVTVGDLTFDLVRPPSAEDLIDEDEYEVDERLPYWADLWPAGRVLADVLVRMDLRGTRVVELGCGLGLPAIVAARRGADMLATDWYEPALAFVADNAARAGVAVATMLVDWRDPPAALVAQPFDLVVAADVLYEARNVAPLAALVPRLCGADGEVIVADPRRNDAKAFLERMATAGWSVTSRDIAFTGRRDETGSTIHLHRLTRPRG